MSVGKLRGILTHDFDTMDERKPATEPSVRMERSACSVLKAVLEEKSSAESDTRILADAVALPWSLIATNHIERPTMDGDPDKAVSDRLKGIDAVSCCIDGVEFVLVSCRQGRAAADLIAKGFDDAHCKVAYSAPLSHGRQLFQQRKLLEHCIDIARSSAPVNASSAALEFLAAETISQVDTDGLLHPALDIIAAYDSDNQSDLLHTLDVYLENDCNAQKCGRILFLHRNSLVYRVRRIQEIAGIDLSNPNERSYLRLSFLLRKAAHNL